MRAAWVWLVALTCLIAVGTAVGGWAAAVAVGLPVYLIVLLAARVWLADRPPPLPHTEPDPRPASWTPADRVAARLSWGAASGRHFDRTTRPLLQRALRAAAASRRLDVDRHRDQVRQLLGETAWYLLDPARPPREDSFTGGVDRVVLEQVVDRLEELTR